jgi:hypothetical protein
MTTFLQLVVLTCLIGLTLYFVNFFYLPWRNLSKQLLRTINRLDHLQQTTATPIVELRLLDEIFAEKPRICEHQWHEYRATLHPERIDDESGLHRIVRCAPPPYRPFFAEQLIVDTPLNADFFKHLPGILTGLGIIGTFAGLIPGLQSFNGQDFGQAQTKLQQLLLEVGHAFIVSATAITLAMLATLFEKWMITKAYASVEQSKNAEPLLRTRLLSRRVFRAPNTGS